jgi:hypothetical protein
MPRIDSTQFGEITVDGKKYGQVLIVGNLVAERDYPKLKDLFGTSHKIGDWEIEELLEENPEIIVVGTGQNGAMEIDEKFFEEMKKKGIEVIADIAPKASEIFNAKIKEGKRVNALIHTTC